MEQRQQMLDDIKAEELNPLNIKVPSHLSQRAKEESYQIQLKKIHEKIDEERYGPEGKPVYEDCCDFYRHQLTKARKRAEVKEAEVWDLERQLRERDNQITISESQKELALRDLRKK